MTDEREIVREREGLAVIKGKENKGRNSKRYKYGGKGNQILTEVLTIEEN